MRSATEIFVSDEIGGESEYRAGRPRLAIGCSRDECGLLEHLERRWAFGDLDRLTGGDVLEGLLCVARWPGNREARDRPGVTETDQLDRGVAAEAAVIADGAIDGAFAPSGRAEFGLDLGAEGRSIGSGADELDLEPLAAWPGFWKSALYDWSPG